MIGKFSLRNLLLLIGGSFALLVALAQFTPLGNKPPTPETEAYSKTLVAVTGDNFPLRVQSPGQPLLLFVYASWCPYCKQQFIKLQTLQARFGKETLPIAYVSLDENPYTLSEFLMETYPQTPFTPYHVPQSEQSAFYEKLGTYGLKPTGGVPYLVFFEKSGKAAGEHHGLTEIPALLKDAKAVTQVN